MGHSKIHAKQSVEVDFVEWEELLLRVSVTSQNVEFGNPGSLYLAFALIYIYFFQFKYKTKQVGNSWESKWYATIVSAMSYLRWN